VLIKFAIILLALIVGFAIDYIRDDDKLIWTFGVPGLTLILLLIRGCA